GSKAGRAFANRFSSPQNSAERGRPAAANARIICRCREASRHGGRAMHVGLVMECDYREARTQEEAFVEAMSIAEIAETRGLDGVWLAERHFAMHRRPTDPMGAGIPSIASVPLVLAAAIAARTTNVRIGTGVSVLPLCHPIRTAEEAATVD